MRLHLQKDVAAKRATTALFWIHIDRLFLAYVASFPRSGHPPTSKPFLERRAEANNRNLCKKI